MPVSHHEVVFKVETSGAENLIIHVNNTYMQITFVRRCTPLRVATILVWCTISAIYTNIIDARRSCVSCSTNT